jgi:hypothetical protein
VEVELTGCKGGSIVVGVDPVQPKEGPLVPSVEHLKGDNRIPLPTGITDC